MLEPWLSKVNKGGLSAQDAKDLVAVAAKRYAKAELAISIASGDVPAVREVAREMLTRLVAMGHTTIHTDNITPKEYWEKMAHWLSTCKKGPSDPTCGCDGFRNCFYPKGKTGVELAVLTLNYLGRDWDKLNIREIVHIIGRLAEPGEDVPYDDPSQTRGIRSVLKVALENEAKKNKLTPFGFSVQHLKEEKAACDAEMPVVRQNYPVSVDPAAKPEAVTAAKAALGGLTTLKKGLLSPLSEIMKKARSKDFRGRRPGDFLKLRLDNKDLAALGLPPMTAGERGWDPEDPTKKGLVQGGEAQRLGPPALKWMQDVSDHISSITAGPSGTTDELLQLFDYMGLSSDALGGWCGRAVALATMGVYYHHSVPEIGQGALSAGRAGVDYDINRPFDSGMLTPAATSNIKITKIDWDGTANTIPRFAVSDSKIENKGAPFLKAVETRYQALTLPIITKWVTDLQYVPFMKPTDAQHQRYRLDGYPVDDAKPGPQLKGGVSATEVSPLENDAARLKTLVTNGVCRNAVFNAEPLMKKLVFPECPADTAGPTGAASTTASATAPAPKGAGQAVVAKAGLTAKAAAADIGASALAFNPTGKGLAARVKRLLKV